jgi:hypothetical protein
MHEHDDEVIEQLTRQRTRPRREPPQHRPAAGAARPVSIQPPPARHAPAAAEHDQPHDADNILMSSTAAPTPAPNNPGVTPSPADPLRLPADEPLANYAVRVRRTLDDIVAWRLAQLRRRGTRTSKVELTELLLWELAQADVDDITQRLACFRQHAPR